MSTTDKLIGVGPTSVMTSAESRAMGSPLYVKNESDVVMVLVVSGSDDYDLDPGEPFQVIPGQVVTASAMGGNKLLQIIAGVTPVSETTSKGPGVSAEDPLFVAAVNSIVSNSLSDLFARVVIELKINNLYNSRAHGEEVTVGDLDADTDYLV